jgi:asparagine N-glycosylation enzyme membrane subunit Stt3
MSFTEGPLHERSDVVVQSPAAAVVEVPVSNGQVIVPSTPLSGGQVRTAYASRFAPDAIIASIAGLVILVVGLIAVVRNGFHTPLSTSRLAVLGFTHTTVLGLIEIGIGGALLISGAIQSRSGAVLFGSVLGIAGFVGAVQAKSFDKSLALESSMAWLAVFVAVIVVLSALMMPRFARSSTSIQHL